jgi:hypothetical protein
VLNGAGAKQIRFLLWGIVLLSLLPALILTTRRVRSEESKITVTLVIDEPALSEQAEYLGTTSLELASRYQALGLNGIALYEETIESLAAKGKVAVMFGHEARALALARGEAAPPIPADSTLVTPLEPGSLEHLIAKNTPLAKEVSLAGRSWYLYPGVSANLRPAGPDRAAVERWEEAGFDIAYRPRNYPNLLDIGQDFPIEAHYLIHTGLQVAGHPNSLNELISSSQTYLTGIIEGTDQDGLRQISSKVPTTRLLSFNQDYINRRLYPNDLIDKFLLAVNERGIRILYLRPYTEEQLGDMIANTELLIGGLREALEQEGYRVGPLGTLEIDYRTNAWLRSLSAVGILAALALLASMFPAGWGPLVATAVLALSFAAGGLDWNALALTAALTFPVIGYGLLPHRLTSLGAATMISLAGATLLTAVGSDREALLAISPFAGVAATLVVPPALFLFHLALRQKVLAQWIRDLWGYPIRLGDIVLVTFTLVALAVVFLRRGNFPVIGVSQVELAVRDWLSAIFFRPRFKEMLGHPLAILGLTNAGWPTWFKGLLLTGGVVAQASILNSFSHYHTPLLVSLQRTLFALALGSVIGLLLVPLSRIALRLIKRWLAGPSPSTTP